MALRAGFSFAKGDYIVTMDADLSYSPDYIAEMVKILKNNEADIVVASPYMEGGGLHNVPFKRGMISRLGNFILRGIFPGHLHTYTGIFRAYRRMVIDGMMLESNEKEIHLEIIARAVSLGYRIKEIPAVLESRKIGKSKFRFGSTVVSHLIFAFLHRPIVLFGAFGGVITFSGIILGGYVIFLHYSGTSSLLMISFNAQRFFRACGCSSPNRAWHSAMKPSWFRGKMPFSPTLISKAPVSLHCWKRHVRHW
jgi:glycosyltransferase involved in cell wall biosynthesis